MLMQISKGVPIDQVPEGSLMNSKNEWNYFRVPRAARKIVYIMLAYMTLGDTQTISVHLT